jgi:uncharacterized protein YjiS (DUF1127 family)
MPIGTSRKRKMNITTRFQKWRSYRRTYNELSRLSGRELEDLGISRYDIASVARRVS